METYNGQDVLFFETQEAWWDWLAKHYGQDEGVWLKFAKKASGITSINYALALEAALCFGWIDGQSKTIDETYYLQKFTPRRARSLWSRRNIGYVEDLIKAGRMQPSGFAQIEAAKQDGRWEAAYPSPSNMTVPDDFQAALEQNRKAKEFFATLSKTNTYAVLWRIATARKPETRQARITKLVEMLERGEKLH
jgi:uncharacterized protein YdeI (YjbR/CyaY-like superfamily)